MHRALAVFSLLCFVFTVQSQVNFSEAVIVVEEGKNISFAKPVQVLKEEVAKRTGITLTPVEKVPENTPIIYLVHSDRVSKLPRAIRNSIKDLTNFTTEGYALLVQEQPATAVIVAGSTRGLLYGVGKLLRKAEMTTSSILLHSQSISTSPNYAIRGHQLGYRPKSNAYDAFTVEQFDQYIRELALFGANSIEIMPPRTDDADTSIHMVMHPEKMMVQQARIIRDYGLDVWMWYPNMARDYTSRDEQRKELQERMEVFAALPKLDHIFVPGGDPGDVPPDVLFSWLDRVSVALKPYHPNAKIWISPQAMHSNPDWMDVFIKQANSGYPWLGGIVFGPWVKMPLPALRAAINPTIPIRRYPDITHTFSAQYPVPDWDVAFAKTLGREPVNPRPTAQKQIHNKLVQFAVGSISYSEGTNDDLNKFIWSDQDWDTTISVKETVADYARLFLGAEVARDAASGFFMLEENHKGPVVNNRSIERTLQQWQYVEQKATPELRKNFRFQMGVLRAYYDAYVQHRYIRELAIEAEASAILMAADARTADVAVIEALMLLDKVQDETAQFLKQKCLDYGDSLFNSTGAQLTVEKHGGMPGRGNFLDDMDAALTNTAWLQDQLNYINQLSTAPQKLAAVNEVLNRTNPGPGGYYDHLGNPQSRNRILTPSSFSNDPGALSSARTSYGTGNLDAWVTKQQQKGMQGIAPIEWFSQINTLYDTPLQLQYDDLENVNYRIRITYTGRFNVPVKLKANDTDIHDFVKRGDGPVVEYALPASAIKNGQLVLTFTGAPNSRGTQVCEVWLIRE